MKNLRIRTKLIALAVVLVIGMVGIGVSALRFMAQINDGSTELATNWLPSVIVANELNTATSDFRIQEYNHVVSQDMATMQACEAELDKIEKQIEGYFNTYDKLATNDVDGSLIRQAREQWTKYLQNHDQMLLLSRENRIDEATAMIHGESKTLFDAAAVTFLEIVNFNKTGGDQASAEGDILYADAKKLTIGILLVLILVAGGGSVLIIRSILKPVNEIDSVAKQIANGKLDEAITYQSKDELGVLATNFNKTVSRLREYVNYIDEISSVLDEVADGNLVFSLRYDYEGEFAKVKRSLENISSSLNDTMGQINEASDQVSSGAEQMSSGAQALSQGATEQASSIEELASAITEISQQVQETAGNAREASALSGTADREVEHCNQQMDALNAAMADITNKSNEIGKIIKTIEDIAFQTNILALNAAVEAARAGAAGKGFAVVADEVRNLASKSAEAAKNTTGLIEGSIQAVNNGTTLADNTALSLRRVVESTAAVAKTIEKISQAAGEQANSIAQVTVGVDQISSVVQTNSATAEESAAASEELSGQAYVLKTLVGRFKLKDLNY